MSVVFSSSRQWISILDMLHDPGGVLFISRRLVLGLSLVRSGVVIINNSDSVCDALIFNNSLNRPLFYQLSISATGDKNM